MKKYLFLFAVALALIACNQNQPTAAMVEGAWELRTVVYDHTVYADQTGTTHYSEESTTRTYDTKEDVWLFYDGHISEWQYVESKGESFWDGYNCDCERVYNIIEERQDHTKSLSIEEKTRSIIPGFCGTWSTQLYKVEKLNSNEMILTTVIRMSVSEKQELVDIFVTYTFRREKTLLDYLKKMRG